MKLTEFEVSNTNWRDQLKKNRRKTYLVIALFIGIYTLFGIFIDIILIKSNFPLITIGQSLSAIFHLQIIPWATITMAGVAIISLLITYAMYDKIMLLGTDYHEVTPETAKSLQEKQLYNVIEEMKVAAGLRFMPKVFIIEANYMNAFASGYSEKSAMVAITRGLMEKLDRAEMQAVMAHELSHIRHQDVKLTLTVAILTNILLIAIDILFYSTVFGGRSNGQDNRLLPIILLLRYILPLITVLLTLFLSRTREYMADSGAVELMRDNEPMARALLKISQDNQAHAEEYTQAYANTPHEEVRQSSYLFDTYNLDPVKSFTNWFSTHPDIIDRLKAIGFRKRS